MSNADQLVSQSPSRLAHLGRSSTGAAPSAPGAGERPGPPRARASQIEIHAAEGGQGGTRQLKLTARLSALYLYHRSPQRDEFSWCEVGMGSKAAGELVGGGGVGESLGLDRLD